MASLHLGRSWPCTAGSVCFCCLDYQLLCMMSVQVKSTHMLKFQLCQQYLKLAAQHPTHTRMLKGHVHKLLQGWLAEFAELRDKINREAGSMGVHGLQVLVSALFSAEGCISVEANNIIVVYCTDSGRRMTGPSVSVCKHIQIPPLLPPSLPPLTMLAATKQSLQQPVPT
eukprot:GHRR01035010.1.p1 GENE.GHRR01035010.1~~GHRR01035010.1.p1  ORF type:complete len:170 (-),score=15.27 GHRR01035010.1:34-543(-)